MQHNNWKQEFMFLGVGLVVILVIESVVMVVRGTLTPGSFLEMLASVSWKVMALWAVRWMVVGKGR